MSKKSMLKKTFKNKCPQLLLWEFNQSKKIRNKKYFNQSENYKDLVVYFDRYVHSKSIKMLSLHCP